MSMFSGRRLLLITALLMLTIAVASAQFANVKIADDALQPSVAINQKNSSNIIIGCGTNQTSYTLDRGQTWQQGKMPFPASPRGEALLRSNTEGEIFFFHNNDYTDSARKMVQLVCQTSQSGGKSWSAAVPFSASGKSAMNPQAITHPKKSRIGVVWVETDQPGSDDPACQSRVLFSQTSDGRKWNDPEVLSGEPGGCSDKTNILRSPSIVMDDERKIYASWEMKESIMMDRSFDSDKNWLSSDMTGFKITSQRSYSVPGVGILSRQPVMMTDNSKSIYKNSLYMIWADQRNGENDTDILFSASIRHGDLWQQPVRVNKDEKGKHQFMPAMTVDETTGIIYVVYYDRRAYDDNQTDVYLAWSTDGGDKFKEKKISETAFITTEDKPFTNSIGIAAHKGVITPVWIRMDEGKTSVWTTVIEQKTIIQDSEIPRMILTPSRTHSTQQLPGQQRQIQRQPRY